MKITWKKVQTGIFDALADGEPTAYGVVNGSLGMSGHDTPNFYIPVKNEASLLKPGFGTTLKGAKEIVEKWLQKEASHA